MKSNWRKVSLGDFLSVYRFEHKIKDDVVYHQVTISKSGSVYSRGSKLGAQIGRKRQFQLDLKKYPNTLIFTRQGINEGAIGIVPKTLDGCVVTENMPMLAINTDVVLADYAGKLIRSKRFYEKVKMLKTVGSAQKSIHERDLLKVEVAIPPIEEQQKQCKKFALLDKGHAQLVAEIASQRELLAGLRRRVLQDAIEGKLTADWRKGASRNYESAEVLLKRISQEKERLIKSGEIAKQKPLPPVADGEKPFALPKGWAWCRLGDVVKFSKNNNIHVNLSENETVNYVDIDAVNNKTFSIDNTKREKVRDLSSRARRVLSKGDIVYSLVRPYLNNIAIVQEAKKNHIGSTGFAVFSGLLVENTFLFNFLLSDYVRKKYLDLLSGFNSPSISQDQFKDTLLPLPPLAEQRAIVAKAEKLLALCDSLQAEARNNEALAKRLMQAALKEAFTPPKN